MNGMESFLVKRSSQNKMILEWVPARVEVDIVFEKAIGASRQLRAVYSPGSCERLKEYFWPNDQGTNVKRIDMLL